MRIIPEDNLAYPVLIKFDTGSTGSSFMLATKEKLFLITAKHVLFDGKGNLRGKKIELLCQSKDLKNGSTTSYLIDLKKADVLKHSDADIGAIEIGLIKEIEGKESYSVETGEGVEVTIVGKGGVVNVDAQNSTKLLEDVLISNDVFLYGYPTSLGLKDSPQFDYSKPLLRKGIIANIYQSIGTIILDCPVYYGNSGGPVVEVSQEGERIEHKIIGVVSEFVPFLEQWVNTKSGVVNNEVSNSGYSVAVGMDKVFELIDFKKS